VADWEAKKAASHVSKVRVAKGLRVVPTDAEVAEILIGMGDAQPLSDIEKHARPLEELSRAIRGLHWDEGRHNRVPAASGDASGQFAPSGRKGMFSFLTAGKRKKQAEEAAAKKVIADRVEVLRQRRIAAQRGPQYAAPMHRSGGTQANRDSYQKEVFGKRAGDETVDVEYTTEISKMDAPRQMFFGWAQIATRADGSTVIDKQGDFIDDPTQLEDAAYDFTLHSRDGGEMHIRKGVSRLVESFVSTEEKQRAMGIPPGVLPVGWWTGFKVDDPQVWAKVEKGEYGMLSVHGRGIRKAVDEDD
jgi:hypothetical protein